MSRDGREKKTDMSDCYQTSDLSEAALLDAARAKLLRMEPTGNRYWFVYANRGECARIVDSYWSREAMVNAKDYADALKGLKDRIYAMRGRQM